VLSSLAREPRAVPPPKSLKPIARIKPPHEAAGPATSPRMIPTSISMLAAPRN
jgi:hypothetical protein